MGTQEESLVTNYYRNHTDEELITLGRGLTATPLERELAERLGDATDTVEYLEEVADEC